MAHGHANPGHFGIRTDLICEKEGNPVLTADLFDDPAAHPVLADRKRGRRDVHKQIDTERQRLVAENQAQAQQQRDYLVESVKVISLAIRGSKATWIWGRLNSA